MRRAPARECAVWTGKTQADSLGRHSFVKRRQARDRGRFLDLANTRGGDSNGPVRRCDEGRGAGRQSGDADRGRRGRLILGNMFGGSSRRARAGRRPRSQSVPTNVPAGSLLGGLTDYRQTYRRRAAPQVNSWIGPGANQPIQPGQLGSALGQRRSTISQRTGMSQQELLNQLALVLPQLINH